MRPPARRQSGLRYPLNEILGTETNVRVLRLLAETKHPVGKSELARRVDLAASGVRRALEALIALGVVETVGSGSRRPVRLREEHPMADTLVRLFQEERHCFESLMEDVRAAVRSLDAPILAAWIESPLAQRRDEPGDVVGVGIASPPGEIERATTEFNRALVRIGGDHDVPIEARGYTPADLRALRDAKDWDLDDVELLHGLEPARLSPGDEADRGLSRARTPHSIRDRQGRVLTRAVVERLEEDPSLIRDARRYLARRLEEASPGEAKELREWVELLEHWSVPQLRAFLLSDSERAARLRQSLPFLHVITQEEREKILETIES